MIDEVRSLLTEVGLNGEYDENKSKQACQLTYKERRILSVAIALCGQPKLVLLDEPTSGLNYKEKAKLHETIKKYCQGKITIVFTNDIEEAEKVSNRIGILQNGKLVYVGSKSFLKKRFGEFYVITLRTKPNLSEALKQFIF